MTRSSARKSSQCHVLNFFYDDEDGCALTVYTNGVRFHIIADAKRLKGESEEDRSLEQEYKKLISAVQAEAEGEDPEKFKPKTELEAAEIHNADNEAGESFDSGHATGHSDDHTQQGASDDDSAVDVSEHHHKLKEIDIKDSGVVLGEQYAPESEIVLQNWMLSPFAPVFDQFAAASEAPKEPTLQEWYHGPTYFFNLEFKDGQLSPSREESSEDLEKRITDLIPQMPLPKYLKSLDIPLVQAKDITVVEEGTEPEPYHPTRVKVNGEVQFLKMVDMSEYQPTKREIKLLKEVEKKGLHKKINVPLVLGLVYEDSKSNIMGFLQTDIEDPTPLTKMLDSDVVEDNRKKWADETERVVKLLHDNDIVWGDAKADNFMVDKHGELWIIDFGGSYTDGWVDPELNETQEGDDMGTEKIVNALVDPEANTFEPDEANEDQEVQDQGETKPSKKRSRDQDDAQDEDAPSKRQK